jgi:hypothetical protein
MNTSSFEISGDHPQSVSIAGQCPDNFHGRLYKKLAPKFKDYVDYKATGDFIKYTEKYYSEVLDKLDPKRVFDDLGETAILLCWEAPGIFCHRRLVAEWFEKTLGVNVPEFRPV